jgi:hypothetical protein
MVERDLDGMVCYVLCILYFLYNCVCQGLCCFRFLSLWQQGTCHGQKRSWSDGVLCVVYLVLVLFCMSETLLFQVLEMSSFHVMPSVVITTTAAFDFLWFTSQEKTLFWLHTVHTSSVRPLLDSRIFFHDHWRQSSPEVTSKTTHLFREQNLKHYSGCNDTIVRIHK